MIGLGAAVRALELPARFAAWLRTAHYRHTGGMAPSARVLGAGQLLNPAGDRTAITIGPHSVVRGELFVFPHAGRINLGQWAYVGDGSRIWSSARIDIGDRVLISHGVDIHDTNGHPLDAAARHAQSREIVLTGHPQTIGSIVAQPISIGDDAWIGFGASVMKGVTIGTGAIVAARSVVVDDVAPWTVVAGNPARVIRTLRP